LFRNETSAFAVAETEAAIVEAETGVAVRDERACEAGGLEALQAEVTGAGDHDSRQSLSPGTPELAVEPLPVTEEADWFSGCHAGAGCATSAAGVPARSLESSAAPSATRCPAVASFFSARNFGPERFRAATTRPSKLNTGAANPTRPVSNSSST